MSTDFIICSNHNMRDKMIEYLEKFKLIKDTQHGFVKNKSFLTH